MTSIFRNFLYTLLFIPFLALTFINTNDAHAALNCDEINGEWSGKMQGLLNGKTTMEIKKCKVKWRLPDGRNNFCRYKDKNGKVEYSCSLGSRGIVKINGNRITMQNVYTAVKHGKYTVTLAKVN